MRPKPWADAVYGQPTDSDKCERVIESVLEKHWECEESMDWTNEIIEPQINL